MPVHRLNAQLPPAYAPAVEAEAATELARLEADMRALAPGDTRAGARLCRAFQTVVELKHQLSPEQRGFWARSFWALATQDGVPAPFASICFANYVRVLKGKEALDRPLEWRPVYDYLRQALFPRTRATTTAGSTVAKGLRGGLMNAVHASRHHFAGQAAADEIVAEVASFMANPHRTDVFVGVGLLVTLLPSHNVSYAQWLPQWLECWNTVDHSTEWDFHWLILFRRACKHGGQGISPAMLPALYARVQAALRLSVNAGGKVENRRWPAELRLLTGRENAAAAAGKLATGLLPFGEPGQASALLQGLLRSIRTFFHPSNNGAWSDRLGQFMNAGATYLAQMVGQNRIPAEACAGVAQELLQLATLGAYSKSTSLAASSHSTSKALLCINGDLFLQQIPRLQAALDPSSVNQRHQAPAALRSLAVMVQPLLYPEPKLAAYIPGVLQMTLPAIDANDMQKTMSALFLYQTVLFWVPFVGSENSGPAPADSEPAYACWAAGNQLVEWSFEFVDRILVFIRDRVSEGAGGSASNDPEGKSEEEKAEEAATMGPDALRRLHLSKLARMDEAISFLLQFVLEQLFQTVDAETHASLTQNVLTFLTRNTFDASSKDMLNLISAVAQGNPEATLHKFLGHVWDQCIKTGEDGEFELKDDVRGLSRLLMMVEGVVRRSGASLLPHRERLTTLLRLTLANDGSNSKGRDLLRTTLRSLLDYYVLDKRCLPPSQWEDVSRKWGTPTQWADVEPRWHEPSEEEREFAAQLLLEMVEPVVTELETPDAEWSAGAWDKKLSLVEAGLNGGVALLVDSEEFAQPARSVGQRFTAATASVGHLRARILAMTHGVAQHFLQHRENDTKAVKSVMSLIKSCTTHRGARSVGPRIRLLHAMREQFSNPLADAALKKSLEGKNHSATGQHASLPRLICLERVELQHMQRLQQVGFDVPRAMKAAESPLLGAYEALLDDLLLFSDNMYAGVRQQAHSTWTECSIRFPWTVPGQLRRQIASLTSPTATYEQLSSAVTILGQSRPLRVIARDWTLLREFLLAVCSSDVAVQALPVEKRDRAAGLLAMLLGEFGTMWHQLSPAVPQAEYDALLAGLLTLGSDANSHWRTQVLVAAALSFTAHFNQTQPLELWTYLCDGIQGDVDSVRLLTTHMLSDALSRAKRRNEAVPPSALARLHSPEFLDSLCEALAVDHRIASRGADGAVDGRQQQAPMGVTELLVETRRWRKRFPKSRLSLVSKAFSTRHAQLLKGFFSAAGPEVLQAVQPHLERMAGVTDSEQRVQQSVVLEMLGGLHRAVTSRLLLENAAFRVGAYSLSVPLLRSAIGSSNLETSWDVVDAIRFSIAEREPVLIQTIADLAVTSTTQALGDRSEYALSAKWLRVCQALFVTFASQVNSPLPAADQLLGALQPTLLAAIDHPYKACREELGRLIYTVFTACSPAACAAFATSLREAPALDCAGCLAGTAVPTEAAETALYSLMHANASGDCVDLKEMLLLFLPLALHAQTSDLPELKRLAISAATIFAESSYFFLSGGAEVAALLEAMIESPQWRTRVAVLTFTKAFYAHHSSVLTPATKAALEAAVTKMLMDPQLEVQDAAGASLAGLVNGAPDETLAALRTRYMDKSAKAIRKSRVLREAAKSDPSKKADAEKAVRRERGAVLGLSALVLAFPYDVPEGIPGVLAQLCGHLNSVTLVTKAAKHTISEFRRTHEDDWEEHEPKFSEEELDALNQTLVSPHYYT